MFNRFLLEINDFKRKDSDDAYVIFQLAIRDFATLVNLIKDKRAELAHLTS